MTNERYRHIASSLKKLGTKRDEGSLFGAKTEANRITPTRQKSIGSLTQRLPSKSEKLQQMQKEKDP